MTLVIIPARMASTRLPGKPLLKIGDKTIIERCVRQAQAAGFDPFVATDSPKIEWELRAIVECIFTGDCASGTDRVAAAAEIIDPEGKHEFVINYQGDMPFLDPEDLQDFVETVEQSDYPVTAYCNQQIVTITNSNHFERSNVRMHIGLYGFPRASLRKFAVTSQTGKELALKLEQVRIAGEWHFMELPSMPIEINTQADLERARSCLM